MFRRNPELDFLFSLARELGKSLAEIEEMDAWELTLWKEFFRRENRRIEDAKKAGR